MSVFVSDERAAEPDTTAVDLDRLGRLARLVVHDQRVPQAMELSILCVDPEAIAELNQRHMGSPGPTDVLAFPIDDPAATSPDQPSVLGDVVLCPAVAAQQATERQRDPIDELDLLTVHGILHLLGHDHAEEAEQQQMFALTHRLLAEFSDAEPGEAS